MATDNFYRNRRLTTVSFAAGILLFLLPFVEIKCNDTPFASLTGVNLVTGSSPKVSKDLENMDDVFGRNTGGQPQVNKAKGKAYPIAAIALVLGIAGLVVSLTKKSVYNGLELLLGLLGAVLLIVLLVQVKNDINSQLRNEGSQAGSMPFAMKVSAVFTAWFYLAVVAFLASALFSFRQKALGAADEVPPPGAPQVPIKNPGDQSNFPVAPSGEEDLG